MTSTIRSADASINENRNLGTPNGSLVIHSANMETRALDLSVRTVVS